MELEKLCFDVVLDSGVLGYNGLGWPPEWLAILFRQLRPSRLAAISKTVSADPITGNFRWWKPWQTIRYLGSNNYVNAYGLTNPGFSTLSDSLGQFCGRVGIPIISVLLPPPDQAGIFAFHLSNLQPGPFGVEVNLSCVNHHGWLSSEEVVQSLQEMRRVLKCPYILKLGVNQDYLATADRLWSLHEAIHGINTVPWSMVFPDAPSPMSRFGGGGVSGPAIHRFAIDFVTQLVASGYDKPIIGGGGVQNTKMARQLIEAGASAVAVGTATHLHPATAHRIANEL